MNLFIEIGEWIKQKRLSHGMTLDESSQQVRREIPHLTPSLLNEYEEGLRPILASVLIQLAKVYLVSDEELEQTLDKLKQAYLEYGILKT